MHFLSTPTKTHYPNCRKYWILQPEQSQRPSTVKELDIDKSIFQKIATLVFKSVNQAAPLYLTNSINVYIWRRSLRSSDSKASTLVLGLAFKHIGHGAFGVAGPKIWNSLPDDSRCGDLSFGVFYWRLHNFLWEDSDLRWLYIFLFLITLLWLGMCVCSVNGTFFALCSVHMRGWHWPDYIIMC